MENKFNTPVLFLIFNRVDTTQLVFNEIRKARPAKLFVAADGPRQDKPEDTEKCQKTRDILKQVDWECKVYTLYRKHNLGCRVAVSSAIDWFFETVPEGIIIEDDCLPEQSFFQFCEEMLDRYRNDSRIMQICGSNFIGGWSRANLSYYFSKNGPIWGWASWRRAWQYYDVDIKLWPFIKRYKYHHDFCDCKKEISFRETIYDQLYAGQLDTWDYQWGLAKLSNSGLCVTPEVNLISNIGFESDATHVSDPDNSFAKMPTSELRFPLKHPELILRDCAADQKYFQIFVMQGALLNRFKHLYKKCKKESFVKVFLDLIRKCLQKIK